MYISVGALNNILYSEHMEIDEQLVREQAAYSPSVEALASVKNAPVLFVVGISGAGKDTLLNKLVATHPNDYQFIISHTTRKPRQNNGIMEQNGREYYFVSGDQARDMLHKGQYIETNLYADNLYGTSIAELERVTRDHKIAICDVDVNGVRQYIDLGMNVKPVFLLPPNYDIWFDRLIARYSGATDPDDLRKRMQTALVELHEAIDNDYYYMVINDDLAKAVELVHEIAHGEQIVARYAKAVELAEQIAERISQKIASL